MHVRRKLVWVGFGMERELDALKERLGPIFRRRELRLSSGAFLDGVLSGVERKTGWRIAEQAGLERPYRMQSLLGRSHWDADALGWPMRFMVRIRGYAGCWKAAASLMFWRCVPIIVYALYATKASSRPTLKPWPMS